MNRCSVVKARKLCPSSCHEYDAFFDLSAGGMQDREFLAFLEALDGDAGLIAESRLVTVVAPANVAALAQVNPDLRIIAAGKGEAEQALYRAISRAASRGHHLVVTTGPVLPGNELLRHLIDEFDVDPMLGTAQPRFADSASDHIWALPGDQQDGSPQPSFPRSCLTLLPVRTITPELPAACTVLRREVVREVQPGEFASSNLYAELGLLLSQARRRGFRNVVVNHVSLPSQLGPAQVYPSLSAEELEQLAAKFPETPRVESWRANLSQRALEAILARLTSDRDADRPRMLLDCRGMSAQHNGTSHSMLGFLDGFQALHGGWEIDVLVSSAAAGFFQLEQRYQELNLVYNHPSDRYAVAVMLNQPWDITRICELHRHALIVLFNMLDTISWDIMYVSDERLDALWRFMARHADGLLYISQFSQERFRVRFAPHKSVAECVTYLSLAREDQVDRSVKSDGPGRHILVFGNDYDHKDVRRTVQLLSDAFPFTQIISIGSEYNGPGNITSLPSGQIEQGVIHRLIAEAQVVVLPSFYEGFGLPVVQSLAYGRPVVVRDSALWRELAPMLRMPGRLVTFHDTISLVEAVGRIVNGLPLAVLPQGSDLADGDSPLTWADCARRVLIFAKELLASADGRRWLEREEALRSIQILELQEQGNK